jgi:hypothetical protein
MEEKRMRAIFAAILAMMGAEDHSIETKITGGALALRARGSSSRRQFLAAVREHGKVLEVRAVVGRHVRVIQVEDRPLAEAAFASTVVDYIAYLAEDSATAN